MGFEGKQAVQVNCGKYPAKNSMGKKLTPLAGQVKYA